MKRMTRREILRQLAGISVLGAVATGVRAAVSPGVDRRTQEIAALGRTHPTHINQAWTTTASRAPKTTTSSEHAHDVNTTGPSADTTGANTTNPPTTNPSTTAPTTTAGIQAADATTSSAAPQVPVGTSQLSGLLGPTTIASGTVAAITGDVELRGDLVVEGVLTSVDAFTLHGNGYQIEVRNGGQLDLRGVPKSGWVRGIAANGWRTGDRVLTAPVEHGTYALSDFHTGSPGVVTLADGRTIAAEQFNLSRSITIDNVSRIMFHMGAGRQVLKHVALTNSGISGKLAFYPIHFHLNGDSTRGSIIEGVVVENGKNHAFVPHGSHGVTFLDCVAFNILGDAFWWDPPPNPRDTTNDSNDVVWQHCLAANIERPDDAGNRTTAFYLGRGVGNRCVDCTAVAVQGGKNSSGFHWPETGAAVWGFSDCVAHNVKANGIFVWQNNPLDNQVRNFVAYRCGRAGIEHGAYRNNYVYLNVSLTDNAFGVLNHALGATGGLLLFEGVVSSSDLVIAKHNTESDGSVVYRACQFPRVVLQEIAHGQGHPGIHEMVNSGLQPTDFDVAAINPHSILRILEGGLLQWEWESGNWTQP